MIYALIYLAGMAGTAVLLGWIEHKGLVANDAYAYAFYLWPIFWAGFAIWYLLNKAKPQEYFVGAGRKLAGRGK